jgi:serine protease Do
MEDTLLMDAAERFAKGEMSAEEKIYFEDLRKNNPELDQAVVEQLFFLNQLDNYSSTKNFKSVLGEVENKLVAEKFLSRTTPETQGKLVQLWHRYKKDIAVAASIAGVVSIFVATIVSNVNKSDKNIDLLVKKVDAQADETRKIKTALKELPVSVSSAPIKQKLDARFRATGFMIDATNNYIVTNAHVVKEASHRLIVENNKGVEFDATAVYVNIDQDLAIIKITDSGFKVLPPLPYSVRKSYANLGESIFLMGYPKAEIVYGEGYVSARNGYKMDSTFCQISTSANEGNSGSPVITKNGDLIGVITSKETDATGVVFAIKSSYIYKAINEVRKQQADEKIKINSIPSLKGLDRESQIKKMEPYVFMIKGN